MDLFTALDVMSKDQLPYNQNSEEFKKLYSPYMFNRFCSSVREYVLPIAEIDKYNLPEEVHYTFMTSFIKKKKHYFDYKAYKKSKNDYEESIPFICRYFEIGKREAMEYIDLMTDSQINEITSLYRCGVG